MKQALLIIDVQNDYFNDGKMPLSNPDKALANIIQLQKFFREKNKPIYYIQHIKNNPTADFFIVNSEGAKLHSSLLPLSGSNEKIITKSYPNSFKQTSLEEELSHNLIQQLVICGMMTHMCVDSTTRQAAEFGYQPILIADACATKDLIFQKNIISAHDVHNAFLSALQNFSDVIDTQEFLIRK